MNLNSMNGMALTEMKKNITFCSERSYLLHWVYYVYVKSGLVAQGCTAVRCEKYLEAGVHEIVIKAQGMRQNKKLSLEVKEGFSYSISIDSKGNLLTNLVTVVAAAMLFGAWGEWDVLVSVALGAVVLLGVILSLLTRIGVEEVANAVDE